MQKKNPNRLAGRSKENNEKDTLGGSLRVYLSMSYSVSKPTRAGCAQVYFQCGQNLFNIYFGSCLRNKLAYFWLLWIGAS